MDELNTVIFQLASDIPLPKEKKDHPLKGKYIGYRECHIKPDWLLIYKKIDDKELQVLSLTRTGTHSDLF
ncbi:MAG: type II toxin-antitoxin system YafQ family toxin [Bacteroidales bacterium]|nr:type II toxin-antitoxin system YafQ family toxin [Bacteroidales bacterium]